MKKEAITKRILEEKLVVIIRNSRQEAVSIIVDGLVKAGIGAFEITANTPGFDEEIKKARAKYPQTLIGAGTIINTERAEKALAAGAQFLVTPNVSSEVAAFAKKCDIPVLMGALTPTEIAEAVNLGVDIVKLFPADNFGIPYMKAVMAPLDGTPLFAVGGIGNENAKAWIEAGAKGLGVGGKLTKLNGDDPSGIIKAAKELKAILAAC